MAEQSGQYDEGQYAEGQYYEGYEGQYAGGQYYEGYEGQYAEGQYYEGYEGQYAEGQYAEGQYAEGQDPNYNPEGYDFVAMYDYNAQNEGELTFKKGDKIKVLSEVKEGWYNAIHNGVHGYCPSNYVKVDDIEARKQKRQKRFEQRDRLRAELKEKTDSRKMAEEQLEKLKKSNDQKRFLLEKLENLPFTDDMMISDLVGCLLEILALLNVQQVYSDKASSLTLFLSSLESNLNKDIKPGNVLEEDKEKLIESIQNLKQVYSTAQGKRSTLIETYKELLPLLYSFFQEIS